ncbi:LysE family translocator [Pseudorhodobacter ferrugineus]|uniref:LysE family translocator n=1 Tax=Pseudorhodobacter ferrugineus TaxID=77008 RepID=UPI00048DDEE3|nr:LysE family translocator [Pseudorhodobacter ferrugineus]
MPPLDSLIAVAFAGFVLSATPGPSMLYVLSRSVGQSRAAGLASALGLALGGMILAVATALGLAAVFAQFGWLVTVLRYAGSAYLVWLGLDMIRSAQHNAAVTLAAQRVSHSSLSKIIWQGMVVEVLNPKTVLFFALFLPPFVHASGAQFAESGAQFQLLILGALVPLTALPSDVVVAFLGGSMTRAINGKQAFRTGLAWVGGVILILIALNLHLGVLG